MSIYLTVGLTGSVCIVNNRQRPATATERFRQGRCRGDGRYFGEREELESTREDEDKEGADSSDDADDFTHVRHKHGGEHRDADPEHSEDDSAAALKGMSDDSSTISLKTQNQVKDDGPVQEIHNDREKLRGGGGGPNLDPAWRPPPEEQNYGVDGDDGDSKEQSRDDHHHVVAWIGHQNICSDLLSKGHEAVHTCEQ